MLAQHDHYQGNFRQRAEATGQLEADRGRELEQTGLLPYRYVQYPDEMEL